MVILFREFYIFMPCASFEDFFYLFTEKDRACRNLVFLLHGGEMSDVFVSAAGLQ